MALKAYEDAHERFTRLDELGTVAVIWHQTGSRDRALADVPELHYSEVAEILFLIERLEGRG